VRNCVRFYLLPISFGGLHLKRSAPKNSHVNCENALNNEHDLKSFDIVTHQWGTWIAGHPWQLYCTGTFGRRLSLALTEKSFRVYLRQLSHAISDCPIAVYAVRERRTSGLGLPPIAAHWHFLLAAAPQHREALERNAKKLWRHKNGLEHILPYDPSSNGAHYVTKLAAGADFVCILENLDRLAYRGPHDLHAHFQNDPYVPDHVKHKTSGRTLVLRSSRSFNVG
jgi:hypothetical protein